MGVLVYAVCCSEVFAPPARVSEGAHVASQEEYEKMYAESVTDPEGFWGRMATENLDWFRKFDAVRQVRARVWRGADTSDDVEDAVSCRARDLTNRACVVWRVMRGV